VNIRRLVIFLAVVAATVALAAGMVQAQAESETFTETFTQEGSLIQNPCNGELTVGDATYHITFHFTDSTHRYVIIDVINLKVSSTGLVTGADYQASGVNNRMQLGGQSPPTQCSRKSFHSS
jgi:hypothetical protein